MPSPILLFTGVFCIIAVFLASFFFRLLVINVATQFESFRRWVCFERFT